MNQTLQPLRGFIALCCCVNKTNSTDINQPFFVIDPTRTPGKSVRPTQINYPEASKLQPFVQFKLGKVCNTLTVLATNNFLFMK